MSNRNSGRRRSRGGRSSNRGPSDGNRLDNRARGNANQLCEKYKSMARDAHQQGDRVMNEYYLQFADHYFRVLTETNLRKEEQKREREENKAKQRAQDNENREDAQSGEQGDTQPKKRQSRSRRNSDSAPVTKSPAGNARNADSKDKDAPGIEADRLPAALSVDAASDTPDGAELNGSSGEKSSSRSRSSTKASDDDDKGAAAEA